MGNIRALVDQSICDRPAGPRGTLIKGAIVAPENANLVGKVMRQFAATKKDEEKHELIRAMGEFGGSLESVVLRGLLAESLPEEKELRAALMSALCTIAGPGNIEAVLRVAEQGDEQDGIAAIACLAVFSGGSEILIGKPDPPTIDSPELREGYGFFVERLLEINRSEHIPPYVRRMAKELAEIIQPALAAE